jgi:hypothetical protein
MPQRKILVDVVIKLIYDFQWIVSLRVHSPRLAALVVIAADPGSGSGQAPESGEVE